MAEIMLERSELRVVLRLASARVGPANLRGGWQRMFAAVNVKRLARKTVPIGEGYYF